MEIVLLIIGIIIGTVVGYLAADRKSAALRAEISGTKKEIELLKLQKEEAEALHKRMNTEFENLSNRIFQSKAEDFTRLNTEHLGNLLRPLGDNLKDFRQKVEQVYSTEAVFGPVTISRSKSVPSHTVIGTTFWGSRSGWRPSLMWMRPSVLNFGSLHLKWRDSAAFAKMKSRWEIGRAHV